MAVGDIVKFDIGIGKNGNRVALNVVHIPRDVYSVNQGSNVDVADSPIQVSCQKTQISRRVSSENPNIAGCCDASRGFAVNGAPAIKERKSDSGDDETKEYRFNSQTFFTPLAEGKELSACQLQLQDNENLQKGDSSSACCLLGGKEEDLGRIPIRPDFRIQFGPAWVDAYDKELKADNVVIVQDLFGKERNMTYYHDLLEEVETMQGKEAGNGIQDAKFGENVGEIRDRLCEYFSIESASVSVSVSLPTDDRAGDFEDE